MIPIKIVCGCGQPYAFDFQPSAGSPNCVVQCPACGADGSEAANQEIQRQTSVIPRAPRLSHTPPPAATGAPAIKRRLPLLLGAGFALVLLLVAAGILLNRTTARAQIAQASKPARNVAVLPNTLEELNAWYAEPAPEKNAANIYRKVFSVMHTGSLKLPSPLAPISPSTKAALEAMVVSNREALDLLREGAKHQESRYPIDLTQGFETTLPHLSKVRDAAALVRTSATWHALQHQGNEAGQDVLTALGLVRSLEAEPVLLSQFIRAAAIATAVDALEQSVNRTAIPASTLSELSKKFQELEQFEARGESFNRAIIGERATAVSIFQDPKKHLKKLTASGLGMKPGEREQWIARLQDAPKVTEEFQFYEVTFQGLMAAREKNYPDRLQADALVRQRSGEAKSQGMIMNDYLMPGRVRSTSKEATSLAHFRLGLTAVALEQFHATHGKQYPPALSDLSPLASAETLKDPFDGQPLRYERKNQGYLLYSIGSDLIDDAGERTHGKDLVFEVGGFADKSE